MPGVIESPFVNSAPPTWASGWGQDQFGYYADFSIRTGDAYWEFVAQRMRWIPAGRFLMGSPTTEHKRTDREGPQHEVTLTEPFWMMQTAVPQELWMAVIDDNPSQFPDARRPVENCDWDAANLFCDRINQQISGLHLRLPTEAEWEYCCRGDTQTPFACGDDITTDQANYNGDRPFRDTNGFNRKGTVSVDDLYQNRWGLIQMHGNVWEWCADWYDAYSASKQENPTGPDRSSNRVVRGGGWIHFASGLRSASRYSWPPSSRLDDLGFRCVSSGSFQVQANLPSKGGVPSG